MDDVGWVTGRASNPYTVKLLIKAGSQIEARSLIQDGGLSWLF